MAFDPAMMPAINMVVSAPRHNADPEQALDSAVYEVFERMLGISCTVVQPKSGSATSHPVSAILGFAGKLTGSCTLSADPAGVALMARNLLPPPMLKMHLASSEGKASEGQGSEEAIPEPKLPDEIRLDSTLLDAFGEISNMIAGGWKNRIPGLDSGCALSVPTIITGSDYTLHPVGDRLVVQRTYLFGGHRMHLSIRCEAHEHAL